MTETPTVTDHSRNETGLEKELQIAINRYSAENDSNTPDFILAQYFDRVSRSIQQSDTET